MLHQTRRLRLARRGGFTILELLIVIGIILAIGGMVMVNLLGASDKSDKGITLANIQTFERALTEFKSEMKRYPSEEEGLVVLWNREELEDDDDSSKWGGPYLKEGNPNDIWGSEWIYRNPSEVEGVAYDIVSIGPDKEEGTDDDISSNDGRVGADGEPMDDFSDFSPSGS
jgi:general secretion pathway protein G